MTGNRKILVISVMQNWGGGEEFLLTLCRNIDNFNFIIASPEGIPLDIFRKNKIVTCKINSLKKIYRTQGKWNLLSSLRILFNALYTAASSMKLIRKENPSIILANGLFAAMYSLPLVLITHKTFFVVQHLIFNESSLEKSIVKLVYKYAEKIVCVSKAVQIDVLRMLNKENSDKVIIIPNSIQLPDEQKNTRKDSAQINIGVVGSIIRLKGIHLIIESLINILKNNNVKLYVYGTTTEDEDSVKYYSEIKEIIKDHNLDSKVVFKGYEESKDKIYELLDIVINYSLVPESFSFTVLESMAYKKIVISADEGGPEEILKDADNGFLVQARNPELLEKKIQFCIVNLYTEAFNKIRRNAFMSVKNEYGLDRFKENYSNLFEGKI